MSSGDGQVVTGKIPQGLMGIREQEFECSSGRLQSHWKERGQPFCAYSFRSPLTVLLAFYIIAAFP